MATFGVPSDSRVLFIDGPVAVFLHEASEQEILESLARIQRYIRVAVAQFQLEQIQRRAADDAANRPMPGQDHDSGGGTGGAGGG